MYVRYITYVIYKHNVQVILFFTVIVACMTVQFLSLHGWPIILIVSDRLINFHVTFVLVIWGIFFFCFHFCCMICWLNKYWNIMMQTLLTPDQISQINASELFPCSWHGTICSVVAFLLKTSWISNIWVSSAYGMPILHIFYIHNIVHIDNTLQTTSFNGFLNRGRHSALRGVIIYCTFISC